MVTIAVIKDYTPPPPPIPREDPYKRIVDALADSTPLPDDIVREIVSYVRVRDAMDEVIFELEDYWDEKFLESDIESGEEDSFEYSEL